MRESETELVVPFHDVDSMRIVWHGHYVRYFEYARSALFDDAGIDLHAYYANTGHLFPVVRTTLKHVRPLRYKDRFFCKAKLVEVRRKIVVEFEIRLAEDGTVCTRGSTEQVAVRGSDFGLELAIPEEIRNALVGEND